MTTSLPTIRHLRLPFQFDEEKLQADVQLVLNQDWIPHFNKEGYDGDWKSIALYAIGGDASNILAHHMDEAILLETPVLEKCLYLKEVIGHFKCPLSSVRLLKLSVGATIKPHRDYKLGYEDDHFRLHIPIITNEAVEFVLDDERLDMLPGECWYTNVNFVHSVANRGTVDRIHLVIDGVRNEWSDQLFFSLAPKEQFFPSTSTTYSVKTMQQMIVLLKDREDPAAKQIISDLEEAIAKQNTTPR